MSSLTTHRLENNDFDTSTIINLLNKFDNDETSSKPKNLTETQQYIESVNVGIYKHDYFHIHVLYF